MQKRKINIIVLSLFIGAIFGGVFGNIFSLILPESVVKDFFLTSINFDLGGLVNNELGVLEHLIQLAIGAQGEAIIASEKLLAKIFSPKEIE